MIERIELDKILSFGHADISLHNLNLIIGANGVGKSNLLRCLSILHHLPQNLRDAGAPLGGFNNFFSRLAPVASPTMSLKTVFEADNAFPIKLVHTITIEQRGLTFAISEERLEDDKPRKTSQNQPFCYFSFKDGSCIDYGDPDHPDRTTEIVDFEKLTGGKWQPDFAVRSSFLRHVSSHTGRRLRDRLTSMRIYGRWDTTPNGAIRSPKSTDLDGALLQPDGANLALVHNLLEIGAAGKVIEGWLRKFNPRIAKVRSVVFGGQIQLFFSEEGMKEPIAATAVSDGTLQFLLLLCVLLHPSPPPLICLEEPDLGLHPDAIPMLARLLRDASERAQIIVTTHNDRLINCFSDTPESILVAERDPETGETLLERKDDPDLKAWLKEFGQGLGDAWTAGEIGGGIH